MESFDKDLRKVIEAWLRLPEHVKKAILVLIMGVEEVRQIHDEE